VTPDPCLSSVNAGVGPTRSCNTRNNCTGARVTDTTIKLNPLRGNCEIHFKIKYPLEILLNITRSILVTNYYTLVNCDMSCGVWIVGELNHLGARGQCHSGAWAPAWCHSTRTPALRKVGHRLSWAGGLRCSPQAGWCHLPVLDLIQQQMENQHQLD